MPKETKQERMARIEREIEEAKKLEIAQYPHLLMQTLGLAYDVGIDIRVNGSVFILRHDDWYQDYEFGPVHNDGYQETLERARQRLIELKEEQDEQTRLYRLKNDLLQRLTFDEKRALGLA